MDTQTSDASWAISEALAYISQSPGDDQAIAWDEEYKARVVYHLQKARTIINQSGRRVKWAAGACNDADRCAA